MGEKQRALDPSSIRTYIDDDEISGPRAFHSLLVARENTRKDSIDPRRGCRGSRRHRRRRSCRQGSSDFAFAMQHES